MRILLMLVFYFISCAVFAQNDSIVTSKEEVLKTGIASPNPEQKFVVLDSLKKEKITVIDTISVQDTSKDFPTTVITTQKRDTTVILLEDIAAARKYDSLWLQELYNSTLFEEVYGTMSKLIGLSDYYFPMFEEALDKYNLPLEIKYLAIVESALRPTAESRVGATGLWQFMFSTGKMFGLDVNSYVDERSDPLKATEAACKYLQSLYKSLGDWDLALAAYNSGPGNVSKAIRRSGGYTNYWNIRNHLPRETAGYSNCFRTCSYCC